MNMRLLIPVATVLLLAACHTIGNAVLPCMG